MVLEDFVLRLGTRLELRPVYGREPAGTVTVLLKRYFSGSCKNHILLHPASLQIDGVLNKGRQEQREEWNRMELRFDWRGPHESHLVRIGLY